MEGCFTEIPECFVNRCCRFFLREVMIVAVVVVINILSNYKYV